MKLKLKTKGSVTCIVNSSNGISTLLLFFSYNIMRVMVQGETQKELKYATIF